MNDQERPPDEPATPPSEEPAAGAGTSPTGAPGPGDGPRRLTRSSGDRVLGGVAGGLGRYFGIDPILFRIGFVVVSLFWGVGVLAYLALLVFVPSDGAPREGGRRSSLLAGLGIAALALAALVVLKSFSHGGGPGMFFWGPGLLFGAVLLALALLVWRAARGGEDGRDTLKRSLVVAGAVVLALAAGIAAAVATALGAGTVVAILVIALGVALVVASFRGGARWLIIPALALAAPLAIVAAADIDLDGGVGEREYRPVTVADLRDSYELGMGELRLDLRDLELPPGPTTVRLRVGMGQILVAVPDDVCVTSSARVGAGYAELLDRGDGGFDVDSVLEGAARPGAPLLRIDADVGLGGVEVDDGADGMLFSDGPRFRRGWDDDGPGFRGRGFGRRFDDDDDDRRLDVNRACRARVA